MSVIHIVLFKLKSSLSDAEVKEVCDHMLSLKTTCVHSSSDKPYIVSLSGGKDNSIEGKQGGFTHGFVVEFASLEDRNYYVREDSSHKEFGDKNRHRWDDVRVIDYTKGDY